MVSIVTVPVVPFKDQRPGTSGLRKTTRVFQQKHYLESYVQALFNSIGDLNEATLILGGDGRYFNREAIEVILKMAAANGVKKVILGQYGYLSTPAASNLIRKYHAKGGIILSASHNLGGENGDFGIKYNWSNGGPAPDVFSNRVYEETLKLNEYLILETEQNLVMDHLGVYSLGDLVIEVIDGVKDYISLMRKLFDFEKISQLFRSPDFKMCFDAMHAITGPYALQLFENELGAPVGTVINAVPKGDFNGVHPDPSLSHAKTLVEKLFNSEHYQFGAASDGDGDRNMILGQHVCVSPGDSLAILVANAHLLPAYDQPVGVARSMPTTSAVDAVAHELGIPCYEVPTGWKFFGNLLDDGRISFCGEESFGTGSSHIREKDGLWAVLFWLNLIAIKKQQVPEILLNHWQTYGRHYFSRHDYLYIETSLAKTIYEGLQERLPSLVGYSFCPLTVIDAYDFSYHDPIDHNVAEHQGLVIHFDDQSRIVYRLSGTGTNGSTLRIYFECYVQQHDRLCIEPQNILQSLIEAAEDIAHVKALSGKNEPDVVV